MKIGDMTIVDWSHNGKCQFWRRGDANAPSLYQSSYHSALYGAPQQEVHASPATYSWQRKVAGIIEERQFYSERTSWRPKRV